MTSTSEFANRWHDLVCYPSKHEAKKAPFYISLAWYRYLPEPKTEKEKEIFRIIKRKALLS